MLFNFVICLAFLTFLDSSVTDESFFRPKVRLAYVQNLILESMMSLFTTTLRSNTNMGSAFYSSGVMFLHKWKKNAEVFVSVF